MTSTPRRTDVGPGSAATRVEREVVTTLEAPVATAEWARACCGPAHGRTWLREDTAAWPTRVVLASRAGPQEYRLVLARRTHRPARDHLGTTLYVPVSRIGDRPGWGSTV